MFQMKASYLNDIDMYVVSTSMLSTCTLTNKIRFELCIKQRLDRTEIKLVRPQYLPSFTVVGFGKLNMRMVGWK